jgi:hypothetical protein
MVLLLAGVAPLLAGSADGLDRLAWAMNDEMPTRVVCTGGREVRGDRPAGNNIYDHFVAAFERAGREYQDPTFVWAADRLAAAGVRVGVYGSLAWEALSAEIYRHLESDVDLICDVSSFAQADASVRLLAAAAARLPCRLDGEVRFPNGCAVAWRELAVAWGNADARVLVKGNAEVGLLSLSGMLEQLEEGALHA